MRWGGVEIVDPWANGEVTFPSGKAGAADFTPIGGPSLSSELTTTLFREEAGGTLITGQITCYNNRTS